jgi:GH25 family lysozyme M1 (1,4-beta-N-acetylmuramidase)
MTIFFPDLSHYKTGVDVSKYPALTTKATEGVTFVDSTYASYKAAAAKAGIPFLAYHFLKHGSISAQVAHVIDVIGRGQPLMLDVETANDGTVATLTDVYSFADQYAAAGGRVTLAYIPHWYWQNKWRGPSMSGLTTRRIGLISSNYTSYSDSGPGWAAYGGVTPVIWQYTSTYGTQNLDMNAFKGTQAQLAALFAGGLTSQEDDLSTIMVEIPKGWSNAGTEIPIEDAVSALMRYMYPTYLAATKAAAQEDPAAVAAALAPELVEALKAALPAGTGTLTQDQVEAALRAVFADAGTPDATAG